MLVIGEDPLRNNKVRRYFDNLRFLAVMAGAMSETAVAADVVLPDTHYLEEPGTRINFEGRLHKFASVLEPPSGRPGWQVLAGLAGAFGLLGIPYSHEAICDQLKHAVNEGYREYMPYYWNEGEPRHWKGPKGFLPVDTEPSPHGVFNYLTLLQRYKQDASIIGIEHFRLSRH